MRSNNVYIQYIYSALLGVGFCRKFPPGFKFGAATAAYQVEGAWNVSDKSASIWDTFVHTRPEIIADRSNGDVACDSYNQWMKDVEIASELGLDFYRFSLSWPRILPNGFANKISEDGVKFYSNLIDALLERGIEPVVTIYHWDLPQNLQDLGEAAELALQLMGGLYSHPIFSKKGGWPEQIERLVAEKSKQEGFSKSRLPEFTKEEKKIVRGTYDFFGLNYYTSRTARRARGEVVGPWPLSGAPDIDVIISVRPEWPQAGTSWLYVYPEGFRKLISWLKKQYGNVEIFITENGFLTSGEDLEDQARIDYHKEHLEQVLLAIQEDKANVVAYTAWSMLDNFEWSDGYRSKFGLYEVDFNDPARVRRPRASAQFYKEIVQAK
ncbi:putative lactase-phlorizin hydrolase [Danaus plexippus plexippus]|uniref:Lactase-phlorizin hydrolase n=1 Tax=Danaus plexippus plexippus TaxID=278856 RepID=A0A212ERJ2_DANPL|nr:myrosinase 1-like [Danaus plexippus plexippus]OWR44112.1 putative lactase-phlorizin hydrolase [Danaus plexippus plexippus]